MKSYIILIVDDDEKIISLLTSYFQKEQFVVYAAFDGPTALRQIREHRPDLMILDLMLPGMDGMEICRRVRRDNDLPIMMLTAKDEDTDRLVGLEIGADDYITKPFNIKEVVLRAKVILRRVHGELVEKWKKQLHVQDLEIDTERYRVLQGTKEVALTPTEFKLLEILAAHPERVYSRYQLVENIQGGYAFDGYERTIDAHIRNLRKKLERDPGNPQYIITVYGIGYKFAGEPHA